MNYRQDRHGNALSILGFGCMRFPRTGGRKDGGSFGGRFGRIDMDALRRQIEAAIDAGVNYFDTAYIYPGSEDALGEVLEQLHAREKVYIASKLPHYLIRRREDMDRIFNEELRRLRTDRIDYYLMHMLTDVNAWEKLKGLGVEDWLGSKQRSGAIGQVGFSYHGGTEEFLRLLDARDWDFCQIQYNYMDEHSQAGRRGLDRAREKGIPVIIMEPLRGGKLVKLLPREAKEIFTSYPVKRSPAEWAFRWLWNQEGITVVLSGMNTEEMIRENVAAASDAHAGDLGEAEEAMLRRVADAINAHLNVGCTGCGYCMPCPHHVDIPGTFAAWNRRASEGNLSALREYIMNTALRRQSTAASNCVQCGACEVRCPQRIAIREELAKARKELEGPAYKIARAAIRLVKAW